MTDHFFERLADWEIRHRGWVLAALVMLSLVAMGLLTNLEFDFRPEALQQFSEDEQAYTDAFEKRFGIRDTILLVILRGSEPGSTLQPRGLELLHRITELTDSSDIAEGVYGLTKLPRQDAAARMQAFALGRIPLLVERLPVDDATADLARTMVDTSRLIPGQLVSRDGATAAVVVVLHPMFDDHTALDRPLARLTEALHDLVEGEAAAHAGDPTRFEVHYAGLPFVRVETVRNLKSEQRSFWPLTAAVYLALLWVVYRRLSLTVLPLAAVGLASLWGLATLPATGTKVNVVNNIVPSLILVIGVCNAVHMLHGFRDARRRGASPPDAARAMMAELGLPAFLTSLTTAIGFASLTVARNPTLEQLGWQAGAGVMLSYLALATLLPVVASLLPDDPVEDTQRGITRIPGLEALVRGVDRWPRLTLALALLALGVSLAIGRTVPVDANVIDTFPPGHPIFESNRLVEEELGGVLPLEVELSASPGTFHDPDTLRQVFHIQRQLATLPTVITTTSIVDMVAEVHGVADDDAIPALLTAANVDFAFDSLLSVQPEAVQQFLSDDGAHLRISARLESKGIQATLGTLDRIADLRAGWLAGFAAPSNPVTLRLTGDAYISARGLDFFIRDLVFSLATASCVIFVVLVGVFRSLRIGLISLLPNLLPLALTLALMPLYGYQLNTSTAIVFTITIGMAVDNTIHILIRFRNRRRDGLGFEEALADTFHHAGSAVVASNLLLIAGFGILFTSDFEPVFRVAALTTTTIAAAMLSALLVLPPLLRLFGRPITGR